MGVLCTTQRARSVSYCGVEKIKSTTTLLHLYAAMLLLVQVTYLRRLHVCEDDPIISISLLITLLRICILVWRLK
jgi:ABC-type anion transport system duplicated permease subunit